MVQFLQHTRGVLLIFGGTVSVHTQGVLLIFGGTVSAHTRGVLLILGGTVSAAHSRCIVNFWWYSFCTTLEVYC